MDGQVGGVSKGSAACKARYLEVEARRCKDSGRAREALGGYEEDTADGVERTQVGFVELAGRLLR